MEALAKQKNKKDMRKALNTLPNELDAMYDNTMERIRSRETVSTSLAERVLGWISHARRPLSVGELQHALAVQFGDVCASRVSAPKKLC